LSFFSSGLRRDDFAGGPSQRRFLAPLTILTLLLLVAGGVALRNLLGLGDVFGGGLLPAPENIGKAWDAALSPTVGLAGYLENGRLVRAGIEKTVKILREGGIPEWYIEACQKIKYMFPRAHATAYVMMAWRIAYCKVHYPLAFYAAYFSIRAAEFDADVVARGKDYVKKQLDALEAKEAPDIKEKATIIVLQLAWEMYLRGFFMERVDIYASEAERLVLGARRRHRRRTRRHRERRRCRLRRRRGIPPQPPVEAHGLRKSRLLCGRTHTRRREHIAHDHAP